jgi:NDP-sugar pyrophosphorylase family protein
MNTDADHNIIEFEEKPKHPKSNLASMGVYIFTWKVLKEYLENDNADPNSKNDFGKNIIPKLLADKKVMLAYEFADYWKDVGTIASLWEANMDLLQDNPEFDLTDPRWKIYSRSPVMPPQFLGEKAVVENSMLTEGCEVYGTVSLVTREAVDLARSQYMKQQLATFFTNRWVIGITVVILLTAALYITLRIRYRKAREQYMEDRRQAEIRRRKRQKELEEKRREGWDL